MENRYPEPICDGEPTRKDRIAAAVIWIGGAALGLAFWIAIIIGAVRMFRGL